MKGLLQLHARLAEECLHFDELSNMLDAAADINGMVWRVPVLIADGTFSEDTC